MQHQQLVIALDYDETVSLDPGLWDLFVAAAQYRGHRVYIVTYRSAKGINTDINAFAQKHSLDIIFTNGSQKANHIVADIWIDDSPVTIPTATELNDMYNGCVANNDV